MANCCVVVCVYVYVCVAIAGKKMGFVCVCVLDCVLVVFDVKCAINCIIFRFRLVFEMKQKKEKKIKK